MTSNDQIASKNGPGFQQIGQPLDRIDGRAKVTGAARYGYEHIVSDKCAFGYILGASIGRGRIVAIDAQAATKSPGVLLVMTHKNAPAQARFGEPTTATPREVFTRPRPVLGDAHIRYFDQPIALVVGETFEAARAAAGSIDVRYERLQGDFEPELCAATYRPERTNAGFATDTSAGGFAKAFAQAPVKVDATYTTAFESHNPMEPHAAIAQWEGDRVTIYTGTQTLANVRACVAGTLQIPLDSVRVVSPFIGGGFGSKLIAHADIMLAALAARVLQRPVKVAMTRQQMFANAGHRPLSIQQVRLGADRDGKLIAIGHEVCSSTARFEEFTEQTGVFTRSLYAADHRVTRHRLMRLDTNRGEWMRAPGEAPGMLAVESAMDELAHALQLDPIELRIRNEPNLDGTSLDPDRGIPFSSRNLIECMRRGARLFGWERRSARPGAIREGRKLIGHGMAAAIRPNYIGPSRARVVLEPRGTLRVQLDMTDIGTGTYTILTQIAADVMQMPPASIKVELGDSQLPTTAGSGGSWGAASAGSAVHDACTKLKRQLLDLPGIPPGGLQAEGSVTRSAEYDRYSQHAFGAHFAEVAVDLDTAEIRVRRMLGAFAAGRILNPKTARSQIVGGMIWGIGAALMEQTLLDPLHGAFINHDLAEYHIPVNADVGQIDTVFIEEVDERANVFGSKGIGELGICGAGAAVANAVFNATGIRVREFPITLEKLLPFLPG
ncbi:xanthine dehydrogenase family protein molybdopterin-binding subunit [Steroidobacter sp. S1-65]|uniref:Xanthine dehydrogenase family protein molybdopterin-binding subunit n=1 Tax=Steroidobacter gossypii TaxID=2805490 RepID=A0ABS1X0Z1_9GAMM|nr:xanthine dehydrogenase family protein molybdopterin-binding subunit [Steroidobacter gossypii]MBM0106842.1 xanthine dehydrogenase family protein molybdopterin-binding subunit [Steroidobacter gossypii]